MLYRKLEQIFDAGQRGALEPKQFEQLVTTLKMMIRLGFDIPRSYLSLMLRYRTQQPALMEALGKMRAPMLKGLLGVTADASGQR